MKIIVSRSGIITTCSIIKVIMARRLSITTILIINKSTIMRSITTAFRSIKMILWGLRMATRLSSTRTLVVKYQKRQTCMLLRQGKSLLSLGHKPMSPWFRKWRETTDTKKLIITKIYLRWFRYLIKKRLNKSTIHKKRKEAQSSFPIRLLPLKMAGATWTAKSRINLMPERI